MVEANKNIDIDRALGAIEYNSITSSKLNYVEPKDNIDAQSDDNLVVNRGVFHINHHKKVIFSKKIKFQYFSRTKTTI